MHWIISFVFITILVSGVVSYIPLHKARIVPYSCVPIFYSKSYRKVIPLSVELCTFVKTLRISCYLWVFMF